MLLLIKVSKGHLLLHFTTTSRPCFLQPFPSETTKFKNLSSTCWSAEICSREVCHHALQNLCGRQVYLLIWSKPWRFRLSDKRYEPARGVGREEEKLKFFNFVKVTGSHRLSGARSSVEILRPKILCGFAQNICGFAQISVDLFKCLRISYLRIVIFQGHGPVPEEAAFNCLFKIAFSKEWKRFWPKQEMDLLWTLGTFRK